MCTRFRWRTGLDAVGEHNAEKESEGSAWHQFLTKIQIPFTNEEQAKLGWNNVEVKNQKQNKRPFGALKSIIVTDAAFDLSINSITAMKAVYD